MLIAVAVYAGRSRAPSAAPESAFVMVDRSPTTPVIRVDAVETPTAATPGAGLVETNAPASSPTPEPAVTVALTPARGPAEPPPATQAPAPTSPPVPTATATPPPDAEIQAVIQQVNKEEKDAFATHNPTLMRPGATDSYYNQMVQDNRRVASEGVVATRMLDISWEGITYQDANHARASTVETWENTLANGTTKRGQWHNVYSLVRDQEGWKVDSDQVDQMG